MQVSLISHAPFVTVKWSEPFGFVQSETKVTSVEDVTLLSLEEEPTILFDGDKK